jgi:hypothetical protein
MSALSRAEIRSAGRFCLRALTLLESERLPSEPKRGAGKRGKVGKGTSTRA